MNIKKYFFTTPILSAALLFLLAATSCVSANFPPQTELTVPETVSWQPVCDGIQRFDYINEDIPLRYHAVKIDLSSQALELVCFPSEQQLKDSPSFHSMRTSTFAKKYNCVVAINATPFGEKDATLDWIAPFTATRRLVGAHIAAGTLLSSPVANYAALLFTKNYPLHAKIIDRQTESALDGSDYAFGGFYTILKDSHIQHFTVTSYDARTGAGICNDGRTLILLVVEGNDRRKSIGLSFQQCASLFAQLGCTDALEFDGGSSSELCINGKSVLSTPSFIVQGNSFGFRLKK